MVRFASFAFLSLALLLTGCAYSNLVTGRRVGPVTTKVHAENIAVVPHIRITRLTCVKKATGKPEDEIELYYGNDRLPSAHFFGPVKMTDGKSCEPKITLELKDVLTIWAVDKDKKTAYYDPHVGIGTLTIPNNALSGHYQFTFDKNASYVLEYDLFNHR